MSVAEDAADMMALRLLHVSTGSDVVREPVLVEVQWRVYSLSSV